MAVLRLDDLCPDGLRIVVPWGDLRPGTSVFVPCVNVDKCKKQVRVIALSKGIEVECRRVFADNILGLRIWRIT